MEKVIQRIDRPQTNLICFGRLPKWVSYFFPQSDIYHGWGQEAKDAIESGIKTYIVTDNPSASGIQNLMNIYNAPVISYEATRNGSYKYDILTIEHFIHQCFRAISKIVGSPMSGVDNLEESPSDTVTRKFANSDFKLAVTFSKKDGEMVAVIESNDPAVDKKPQTLRTSLKDEDGVVCTLNEFKNSFEAGYQHVTDSMRIPF